MDADINQPIAQPKPLAMLPELGTRVVSLDGLRALSIGMVLFSHAGISCNFPAVVPQWLGWMFHGQLGVRIFFVISGFIITLLILREEQQHGSFSVRNFYIRRILRIIPVYYVFIICVLILVRVYDLAVMPGEFAAAFTFTTGWWAHSTWLLGHTWSLSVEEQFYLLWPLALYLIKSARMRIIFAAGVIALYPLMRVAVYLSSLADKRGYLFITQGDAILFGCLLSLLLFYHGPIVKQFFTKYVNLIRVFCIFLIWGSTGLQSQMMVGLITVPLSNTVESLAIAWLLASCIFNRDVLFWLLNSKVMVFIGAISYSWYLWQELFLFDCDRYFTGALFHFPTNLILSFIVASASYFLIEKPFERLKKLAMA